VNRLVCRDARSVHKAVIGGAFFQDNQPRVHLPFADMFHLKWTERPANRRICRFRSFVRAANHSFAGETQRWSPLHTGLVGWRQWSKDSQSIFLLKYTEAPGVYRIPITGGQEGARRGFEGRAADGKLRLVVRARSDRCSTAASRHRHHRYLCPHSGTKVDLLGKLRVQFSTHAHRTSPLIEPFGSACTSFKFPENRRIGEVPCRQHVDYLPTLRPCAWVLEITPLQALFVDRVTVPSILASAITIWGEHLLPQVPLPPIRRLDVAKAFFSLFNQALIPVLAYPFLFDPTRYAMDALKRSVHNCYFVYHSHGAHLVEETAFFQQRLGANAGSTLAQLMKLRTAYHPSFGFVLHCLPILVRLHWVTGWENHFPREPRLAAD